MDIQQYIELRPNGKFPFGDKLKKSRQILSKSYTIENATSLDNLIMRKHSAAS